MANAKEIRTKIASVKSTAKITKAMQMVAASKMRKTQARMSSSRPYATAIRNVISHVAKGSVGYKHPFLVDREIKNVGYLVISTDRGLCGGLNINLFKSTLDSIKTWKDKGVSVNVSLVGSKAVGFFHNLGLNVLGQTSGLGDTPSVEKFVGIANTLFDKFRNGEIDAIYIVYNKFVNTMSQKPTVQQLVPLPEIKDDHVSATGTPWDYEYEPDANVLLDKLLIRYLESHVYQAVVENLASEQAARMVAMKSATDNAGNLIEELQLVYNKARQASITNELNEIIAGAAAI